MYLFYLHKDQDVIQVYYYDPFSYESSKDVIHYSLEGSGTVGHSKEHHERFEEVTVGVEGHLPFISRLDTYIIETPLDIKFCEVPGSTELGDKFRDEEEGISVLNGYGVQHTIVLDQLEQTIFLFNEEHKGCYGRFGRSDLSSMQVFLQRDIQLSLFQWG